MPVIPRSSALVLSVTATTVVAVDLVTSALAVHDPTFVGHGVIYNPDFPTALERLAVCAATIAVLAAITRVSQRRGGGPLLLMWLAGGLLVGGVVGNWVASAVWQRGVPDFIARGDRMWNLADFSIGLGMLLMLASSIGYTIRAFVRSRRG